MKVKCEAIVTMESISTKKEMNNIINNHPWQIKSIYELQYFICPSCDFKNQNKQEFIHHANEIHPEAIHYLKTTIEDNSLEDVWCPWEIKIEFSTTFENENNLYYDDRIGNYPDVKNDNYMEAAMKYENDYPIDNEISKSHHPFVPKLPKGITLQKTKQVKPKTSTTSKCIYNKNENACIKNQDELRFKCDFCSKFIKKKLLNEHIKNHHEKANKNICEFCPNFTCKDSTQLREHIRAVHEKIRDLQCETCGKKFLRKKELRIHNLTFHEKAFTFLCTLCGKGFVAEWMRNQHNKMVHERVKNIICNFCEELFAHNKELKAHIISKHGGIKQQICQTCGKSYITELDLKIHISCQHVGRKKIDPSLKKHQCEVCGKSFLYKKDLNDHNNSHTGEKPYCCEICGASFAARTNLQNHCKSVHEGMKRVQKRGT